MGYMPVSLYLPIYTSSLSTPGKANLLVAIFNLSSSVGSTLTGYTSDYSLPVTLAVMGTAGAVLSLTAWGLASSLGAVFAFAVLFAAFSQVCSCVSRSRSSSLLCLSVALSLALSLLTGRRADLVLDLPPARPQSLGRRRPRRRRRQPALVDHDLLPVRRRAWRRVDRRPVHLDGPVRGEAGRRRAVRRAPSLALCLSLLPSRSRSRSRSLIKVSSLGLTLSPPSRPRSAAWGRFGFRSIIVFVGVMACLSGLGGPAVWWARRRKATLKSAAA